MSVTSSATFCPAPWTSLNIDQTGRVSCCMFGEQSIGNIKQNSIQEIIQGPALQDIKQIMAQGQWHSNCVQCRRNEDVTGASARTQRMLDQPSRDQIDQDINWFDPQHLVINWSNLCNLTCTYCNSDTSTAWQAIKGIPINYVRNEHQDLVDLARQHGSSVQGLVLGGGEPLLQKGLVEFLQCLDGSRVRALVTTNLSVDLATNPVYQELKNWKTVEWQISFDNAERDKFEYVRDRASWDQFERNIDIMKADGQFIKAHPAYSIYCAFDLLEYYDYCVAKNIDLFWCELTHPWDLDIRRYPMSLRQRAIDEIDRVLSKYGHREDLAIPTLKRYRMTLLDNSYIFNQDTYTPNAVEFHQRIERELNKTNTFTQLWPKLALEIQNETPI
jgi:organic radical activating enzyme